MCCYKNLVGVQVITMISMLGAFLVNRKSIPELIRDRIHNVTTSISLILIFIYYHTDIGDCIGFSFIGFQGGWFLKDLWIYLHTPKE